MRWLRSIFASRKTTKASPSTRRHRPALEILENRVMPIVGNLFQLPPLFAPVGAAPGAAPPGTTDDIYNGVVQVINQNSINANPGNPALWTWATGTLLPDGRHILSAGHTLGGFVGAPRGLFPSAQRVGFYLVRTDGPGGAGAPIPRTINLNIPAGAPNQMVHPYYLPGPDLWPHDIGLMTIPDQVIAGTSRQMVAPYYGPQIGIAPYTGTDDGGGGGFSIAYTVVGYGLTGTGAGGSVAGTDGVGLKRIGYNTFDANASILNNEVQTVGLTGAASTFRLVCGMSPHCAP